MKKIIFLTILMTLGLTGMAQAADGCKCVNVLAVLDMGSPKEKKIHFLDGIITMQVNQGSPNTTYYFCLCDDIESECYTASSTVAPNPLYWHEYDETHWQESAFAPCRWYTTTEGVQCGDYGC